MSLKKPLLLVLLGTVIIISACKKEGCTDENAINYSFEANKENNTCTYEGNILFWFDESTAINLQAAGVDSLRVYLDSALIRRVHVQDGYSYIEPDCDNGLIKKSYYMGTTKTENANYYVHDQNGVDVFTGTFVYSGGECVKENLIFP